MKKRVLTAAILVGVVLVLFLLPAKIATIAIAVVCALTSALAYKELLDLKESHHKFPSFITVLGFIGMELMVFNRIVSSYIYMGISYGMIGIIFLLLLIPSIFDKKEKYTTQDALYLIGSITVIGLFFNLLMLLFNGDKWILLYLLLVSTMTDTFAMLIGCLIGKHKLIPSVSPKKSVEGSIAGSLLATIISSIYYINIIDKEVNIAFLIIMSLVLTILGQLGDLFFSKMKRENNIKDFSNLMPGHGGILDRFDSLTFILYGYIIIINIFNLIK